ncbi:MAG: hypothetical protein QNJ18_16440 [Xenococcaceae cyanobacterium MO_167.B52]|nr:hypothetical protein [Xenococcaceae cyanobacterium MO_167.B52]
MAKDEFETVGKKQQREQKLVNLPSKALNKPKYSQNKQKISVNAENLDTVATKSPNWWISGIVGLGLLTAIATIVVPQLQPGKKLASEEPTVTAKTSLTLEAPKINSLGNSQEEQAMLLEQAKLVAQSNKTPDLARAIAIVSKLPTDSTVNDQAQSLTTSWSQQILEQAKTQASKGDLAGAVAIAKSIPQQATTSGEVTKQIAQWQQQQQQAEQQKFALALAEASRPIPITKLPPPPPIPTRASKTNLNSQPTPRTTVKPTPKIASVPAQQPKIATLPANKPPSQPPKQVSSATQPAIAANDPYLNVTIPQVQTKPIAPKVSLSNSSSTSNSYGFRNVTVFAPQVPIELIDYWAEDGDYVTLKVNGKVVANNQMIRNYGKVIMLNLQPGRNLVEIVGVKDGRGGITLEANIAGVGNVNNRPIPEGRTASFIINRKER